MLNLSDETYDLEKNTFVYLVLEETAGPRRWAQEHLFKDDARNQQALNPHLPDCHVHSDLPHLF